MTAISASIRNLGATVFLPRAVSSGAIPDAVAVRASSALHVVADAPLDLPLPSGVDGQQLYIVVTGGGAEVPVTLRGALLDAGAVVDATTIYAGDSLLASWSAASARWILSVCGTSAGPIIVSPAPGVFTTGFASSGTSVLHVDTSAGAITMTLTDGGAAGQLLHVGRSAGLDDVSVLGTGMGLSGVGNAVTVGGTSALLAWDGLTWGLAAPGSAPSGHVVAELTAGAALVTAPGTAGLLSLDSTGGALRVTLPTGPGGTPRPLRFHHALGSNGVTFLAPGGATLGSSAGSGNGWTAAWNGAAWTVEGNDSNIVPYVPVIPEGGEGAHALQLPLGTTCATLDTRTRDVRVSPPASGSGSVRMLKSWNGTTASTGGSVLLEGSGISITAPETSLPAVTVRYAGGVWGASLGSSPIEASSITAAASVSSWITPSSYDLLVVNAAAGCLRLVLPGLSDARRLLVARTDSATWNSVTIVHTVYGASLSLSLGTRETATSLRAIVFSPAAHAWVPIGSDRYAATTLRVPVAEAVIPRRCDVVFADTTHRDVTLSLPTASSALLTVRNVGEGNHKVRLANGTPALGSTAAFPLAPGASARLAFHGGPASSVPSYGRWISV